MFRRRSPSSSGFTLIELIVVISIIAILSLIIILDLRQKASSSARDVNTLDERDQVRAALQLYYFDHGGYPTLATNPGTTCVGSSQCVLGNTLITGTLPVASSSSLTLNTLPIIKDAQGNANQGFVYLSCSATNIANGVCSSGTSFLVYPTNAGGEVCQTVGIWESPFPYGTKGCSTTGGNNQSQSGNGSIGSTPVTCAISAVDGSFSGRSIPDDGSSHTVLWAVTAPLAATDSYVWTNNISSLTAGSCSPSISRCVTFAQTLSPTDIDKAITSGNSNFQTTLTASNQYGQQIGTGRCGITIVSGHLSATCTPSATTVSAGNSVNWLATPSGGRGPYGYIWTDTLGALHGVSNPAKATYYSAGLDTGSVKVSSADGQIAGPYTCSSTVTVTASCGWTCQTCSGSSNYGSSDYQCNCVDTCNEGTP